MIWIFGRSLRSFRLGKREYLAAVEVDLAGSLVLKAQYRTADGGLSAAGFAHQTHRGAAFDLKGSTVYGLHVADRHLKKAGLDRESISSGF